MIVTLRGFVEVDLERFSFLHFIGSELLPSSSGDDKENNKSNEEDNSHYCRWNSVENHLAGGLGAG